MRFTSVFILFALLWSLSSNAHADVSSIDESLYLEIDIEDLNSFDFRAATYEYVVVNVDRFSSENAIKDTLLTLREAARFLHVKIEKTCAGDCSLYLLPIADTFEIDEQAQISLTSSSVSTIIEQLSDSRLSENTSPPGLTTDRFRTAERNFGTLVDDTAIFMKIMAGRGKSPHHLMMHSMAMRSLHRRYSSDCLQGFEVAILLDDQYLRKEFHKFKRVKSPPNPFSVNAMESHDDAAEKSQILIEPYTFSLINVNEGDPSDRQSCLLKNRRTAH